MSRVSFHDYEVDLPVGEGWQLARMAPEDEAITIRLMAGAGADAFQQAELSVARVGVFDPRQARLPGLVFAAAAAEESTRAKAEALSAGAAWRGARADSVEAAKKLYRLWYGIRSGTTTADAWIAYWFPPSFASDGFYLRSALQYWERPGAEDVSVLDEFVDVLSSLAARQPTLDQKLVPARGDSLASRKRSLPLFYYDARALALHSPNDTSRAPCWSQLEDSVAIGVSATRIPGITFVSFQRRTPPAGDRTPGERFGKAFDRDGDGRFDLLLLSQGTVKGRDGRDIRSFYVIADDDGDGRVDGVIYEDGDNDRDGRVDHALFVQDRARRGGPDRAWLFGPDAARPIRPAPHQGNIFFLTRASRKGEEKADLGAEFTDWNRYLAWANRAKAHCGR